MLFGVAGLGIPALSAGCTFPKNSAEPGASPTHVPVALERSSKRIGGDWVKPKQGDTITTSEVEICAKPSVGEEGAPAIDHVNFTANVQDPDNPGWKNLQTVSKANEQGEYCTTEDFDNLEVENDNNTYTVPEGQVTLSFDVYNTANEYKNAPDGEIKVIYSPDR